MLAKTGSRLDYSILSICRSLLFVPASSESILRKAAQRGADFIIVDLEDSVHPESKSNARQMVHRLFLEGHFSLTRTLVRINSTESSWVEEDLRMVASVRPAGVVLPKIEVPQTAKWVDERLDKAVPLFPLIESAAAVLNVCALARSCSNVAGLIFGAADYRASMNARPSRCERELLFAKSQLLHAARASERKALDSPWFNLRDRRGLERSCLAARNLGFDGKTAIHPSQVPIINDRFSPMAEELRRAQRIVEIVDSTARRGGAVATLDGELIEELHARKARDLLDMGRRLGIDF